MLKSKDGHVEANGSEKTLIDDFINIIIAFRIKLKLEKQGYNNLWAISKLKENEYYTEVVNDESIVVKQIEHKALTEKLDEILRELEALENESE